MPKKKLERRTEKEGVRGDFVASIFVSFAQSHYGYFKSYSSAADVEKDFKEGTLFKRAKRPSPVERQRLAKIPFKWYGVTCVSYKEVLRIAGIFGKKFGKRIFKTEAEIVTALREISKLQKPTPRNTFPFHK